MRFAICSVAYRLGPDQRRYLTSSGFCEVLSGFSTRVDPYALLILAG